LTFVNGTSDISVPKNRWSLVTLHAFEVVSQYFGMGSDVGVE